MIRPEVGLSHRAWGMMAASWMRNAWHAPSKGVGLVHMWPLDRWTHAEARQRAVDKETNMKWWVDGLS